MAHHMLRHLGGVQYLPILRIHRPIDHGGLYQGGPGLADGAIGWTQPVVPLPQQLFQQHLRFLDLLHHLIRIRRQQPGMAVGVIAHLVAFRRHPPQQILIAGDLLADHKKRGRHAPLQQAIQKNAGGVSPGSIIKGKGHIFGLLHQILQRFLIQLSQNFLRDLRSAAGSHGTLPAASRQKQKHQQKSPISGPSCLHYSSPQRLVCAAQPIPIPAEENGQRKTAKNFKVYMDKET